MSSIEIGYDEFRDFSMLINYIFQTIFGCEQLEFEQ